jgi:nitrogenase subunit NifH
MNTAADTITTVAQNFVEKNRTKAKLNRLRMVMKSESELMNRAYIALGKEYYEMLKKGDVTAADEKQKNLLGVIDNSKAKIAKARECYRMVLESQSEFVYAVPSAPEKKPAEVKQEDVVDITVACSNEDDYDSNPFDAVAEKAEEVAGKAEDAAEKAAETAADAKEHIAKAVKEALDEEYPDGEPF